MQNFSFQKLALNTFSLSVGRLVSQILNVIFVPIALLFISPGDYGTFSILQIAALIAGVVMSLGISTVFISQFGNSRDDSENLLGRMVGQQVVFGFALILLAFILSNPLTTWLASTQSRLLLPFFFVSQYFANIVLIFNRWQILTNRHWQLSIGAISNSVGGFIFLFIYVIWKHYGLLGLVISDLGSNVITLAVILYLSRNAWKLEFRKVDIKPVIKLGLPAAPYTIFFWLLVFLPLYLLRQQGLLILAGAFSLGWKLFSPVDLLGNSLASAAANKILDKKTNLLSLNRWYRISIFGITFSTLGILFYAKDILHLFFRPDYYQILALLPLMGAGVLFLSSYYFEWISISGSVKTFGLSIASGGGVLVLLIGSIFFRNMINGLTVVIMFSLSFFTMWLIARRFNSGTKLGYSPYLVAGIILTVVAGSFMTMFAANIMIGLVKFLILGFIVLAAGLLELFIWSHEAKTPEDQPGSFLKIPNYAEIAKKVGNPSSILDIGCSEGFFLRDITVSGLKVGIEKDLKRLIAGRSERKNVNFVCADAANLPFRQNSFETVVMIGVMPYLDEPREVLCEVHRILTNQGQVEISTVSVQWFYRYLNIYNWKYKFHFYSSAELETILKTTGFNVKSIVTRGKFIAPLLSNLFVIPNLIDRFAGNTNSVLGPTARLARAITNPWIQWEYDHQRGVGYQIFASGTRDE